MGGVAALARELGHEVEGSDAEHLSADERPARRTRHRAEARAITPNISIRRPIWSSSAMRCRAAIPAIEYMLDARLPYVSGPQWIGDNILASRACVCRRRHARQDDDDGDARAGFSRACGRAAGISGRRRSGKFRRLGAARLTADDFVIEADEYDTAFFDKRSKFVHYHAHVAILNNLEYDHADIFPGRRRDPAPVPSSRAHRARQRTADRQRARMRAWPKCWRWARGRR